MAGTTEIDGIARWIAGRYRVVVDPDEVFNDLKHRSSATGNQDVPDLHIERAQGPARLNAGKHFVLEVASSEGH